VNLSATSFGHDAVNALFDLEAFLDTRVRPQGWQRRQQVVRQLSSATTHDSRGLLTAAKDHL
jgi:hypothetical protein